MPSEGPSDAVIRRVTALDLRVESRAWPFAEERRAEIDAHFTEKRREKPKMWNGRVLLARDVVFNGGRLSASYFEGALRCADGAFVLGEMAGHTSNAGRIYFPSGTPDPDDVFDGRLDISASVEREMEEETGLRPADYLPGTDWDCVVIGASVAIMKLLTAELPGEALKARIEANLARQAQPELSAIHLVRGTGDFSAGMPRFITAYLERQFRG